MTEVKYLYRYIFFSDELAGEYSEEMARHTPNMNRDIINQLYLKYLFRNIVRQQQDMQINRPIEDNFDNPILDSSNTVESTI